MNQAHTNAITDRVTFGFWIYLMSDCVLFAGLFASYAVLHTQTYGAAAISDIVNVPYVLVETLILLTSSFTVGVAMLAAQAHKKNLTLAALCVTLLLGLAFLGMELHEFAQLAAEGAGPSHSAFLSSFFVLLGTHGLHVALGSLWMLVILAHVYVKDLSEGTIRKLTCLALFWHFLDIIWIFIFTFVYLFGAL